MKKLDVKKQKLNVWVDPATVKRVQLLAWLTNNSISQYTNGIILDWLAVNEQNELSNYDENTIKKGKELINENK